MANKGFVLSQYFRIDRKDSLEGEDFLFITYLEATNAENKSFLDGECGESLFPGYPGYPVTQSIPLRPTA
jgi:hypothetical protein